MTRDDEPVVTQEEEQAPEPAPRVNGRSKQARPFYRVPKLYTEELIAGYPASESLVLRGVTLEVRAGEIVALVGPNGSGKSTMLRALARVLAPRRGVVYLEGKSMREWPTREVARKLALLPQGPTLAADLTVEELVTLGRSPHQGLLGLPTREDSDAVQRAIEETDIGSMARRRVSELSGGERQRVWVAMALAQEPQILLLDEPTTFLDLNHQLEVLDLIRRLNQEHGLTVIMVLHDLNQAARYSGRIVVLREGQLYADGSPAEVLTPATLRDVFGVRGRVMEAPDGAGLIIVPISRA
ncbi:MAG TPA: ABC transporter ATP-binding protein [Dehalococcoidia bacterium]|nr:ABC transporter ATP-binding protein [Dehalococcoidia bacterium]